MSATITCNVDAAELEKFNPPHVFNTTWTDFNIFLLFPVVVRARFLASGDCGLLTFLIILVTALFLTFLLTFLLALILALLLALAVNLFGRFYLSAEAGSTRAVINACIFDTTGIQSHTAAFFCGSVTLASHSLGVVDFDSICGLRTVKFGGVKKLLLSECRSCGDHGHSHEAK